ncbi:MAG TPA: trypsin-like serine protease [Labilithrix sp.]|nr:trypsin-like serine protease [Labilithrix sp.]
MPRFAHGTAAAVLALVSPVVALGCGSDAGSTRGEADRLGAASAAIVGGEPSTAADDFVVFLTRLGDPFAACGATLLAPNLVVTAKHCVYEYAENPSICDGSGLPAAGGGGGGYVGAPIKLTELAFYGGYDAKDRMTKGEAPAAAGAKVIDDRSVYLCSHDLAYVVLDKPMTGLPLGKLRLGERPKDGTPIAVAGWGAVEDRIKPKVRQRRSAMVIARVGPVEPSTGSVGPRTFESGPGPCTGDSGSPAFFLETGTALGVTARALGLVDTDPVSPCRPDTVASVFVDIVDFPLELRAAFAAAKAEPWLEGAMAPGFRRFGEACSADLECEGGKCAGASAGSTKGTCNVDCSGKTLNVSKECPKDLACSSDGLCVVPPSAPPAPTAPAPVAPDPAAAEPEARTSGCASAPGTHDAGYAWLFAACAVLVRSLRIKRSARRAAPPSSRRT